MSTINGKKINTSNTSTKLIEQTFLPVLEDCFCPQGEIPCVVHRKIMEAYFEDIELDTPYRSRQYHVTEDEIIGFAKEWNPEPFHIDKAAAQKSKIGKIFACGPHIIAICTKLTNERRPRPATVAGLGWDELRFTTPVFHDDRLWVEITAKSKRRSNSNPGVGIVVYTLRVLNQMEQEVLTYTVSTMVECRLKG